MEPFNFRFQKILDYRKHLETQEKHKFAEVLKEYADVENELNKRRDKKQKYLSDSKRLMNNNDFASLAWRGKARNALEIGIEENKHDLEIKNEKLEKEREELLEFTKAKKIMEKLKEKDLEKYIEELKKENKHITDEIAQQIYLKAKKTEDE